VTPDYTLGSLTQPTGPAPGARKRRTGLIVGLTVAGVLVLAAAAVGVVLVVQAGSTMTVHGTVTIQAHAAGAANGETCSGHNDVADIDQGVEVQITDAGNATVALAALGPGKISGGACVFTWTAAKVPTGKGFYGITVGRRPSVKVPEAALHQDVPLSLG
jgi:hypothetical protein